VVSHVPVRFRSVALLGYSSVVCHFLGMVAGLPERVWVLSELLGWHWPSMCKGAAGGLVWAVGVLCVMSGCGVRVSRFAYLLCSGM
jgi:hypothetical protein